MSEQVGAYQARSHAHQYGSYGYEEKLEQRHGYLRLIQLRALLVIVVEGSEQ